MRKQESNIFIIALGNPLRRDDGAAHLVADRIESSSRGRVSVIKRTFLDIRDLPQIWTEKPSCLFVIDACRKDLAPRGYTIVTDHPSLPEKGPIHHSVRPSDFQSLATLRGWAPTLVTVLIAGENFGHGSTLSPYAQKNALSATEEILNIIKTYEVEA